MGFFNRQRWAVLLAMIAMTVGAGLVSAQTWNCGQYGDNVTATKSGGTLTISGRGAMKDYDGDLESRPWHESRGTISKIVINDGVATIGAYAFYEFVEITSIPIPSSVTSIGERAFGACANMLSIDVAPSNANYSSEDGVLFSKDKTTLIYYPRSKQGAYNIPNGVVNIGDKKFGTAAFSASNKLTSVTIPSSVKSIVNGAFKQCTGLTSVTIGNGVASIGQSAFQGCTGLTSVTIGSNVAVIEEWAFALCPNLTTVTCLNVIPPQMHIELPPQYKIFGGDNISDINGAFSPNGNKNTRPIGCLYVPQISIENYKSATYWKEFPCIKAASGYVPSQSTASPQQLEKQCVLYYDKDMYDKAIEVSTELIRIDPNSLTGYITRGLSYKGKKDYDRAIPDLTMALKLAPKGLETFPLNHRGYAYLGKRDYDKALADFNKAVQLAPNEANPYDSRGEAYLIMGEYDKAIADYSQALRLDPNMESARKGLAEAKNKKKGR
jgi:hypothetical protein